MHRDSFFLSSLQSFEKVLVQNIQFGLSPPLTKALGAIPRWRLLQGALPHVMHACAALLYCRVKDMQAIGPVETKLLYTMQWILLYAAEECADDEGGDELGLAEAAEPKPPKAMDQYLFSVPTITVSSLLYPHFGYSITNPQFIPAALCVSLRTHHSSSQGVGLSELSPRERHQAVAGYVGQSCARCTLLHCAREAQGAQSALCTHSEGLHRYIPQAFAGTRRHVTQGGFATEWHHRLWPAGRGGEFIYRTDMVLN